MAKPTSPLLSLEAHGTLADTLTYQGKGERKIARKKPRLPYFLTLPVQYQRWLYQDYAHGWRDQSAADQKAMRAAGVRFHLTGFQYWMKYNLTHLPDIVAWWKLDDTTGPTTGDSSRNGHTATIFGASPTTLAVNGALTFDGINDYVRGPAGLILPVDYITIEFCLHLGTLPQLNANILRQTTLPPTDGQSIQLAGDGRTLIYWTFTGGVNRRAQSNAVLTETLTHVVCLYDRVSVKMYLDGTLQAFSQAKVNDIGTPTTRLFLGCGPGPANWTNCKADNLIIYNRPLTQTEITRHSTRRWPPQ